MKRLKRLTENIAGGTLLGSIFIGSIIGAEKSNVTDALVQLKNDRCHPV